jgi:histidine triad (HIT) family protein
MNCMFCRIIRGEAPAKVFYQDDDVIVFFDRAPLTSIHLLVCPRTHYADFMDAPFEVHQMLAKTVKRVITELGERARDFRIMINNGPRSGQTVFHLHYHILAGK